MRLDEKARESLEAVERLLHTGEAGEQDALLNAAASRAYYAAYQAVVDAAIRDQRPMEPGKSYHRHDTLPDRAVRWQLLTEDLGEQLFFLQSLRVKADYFEDQIDHEEASQAAEAAVAIVNGLLKRGDV